MVKKPHSLAAQITSLPIGDLFQSVALGLAEAQTKLDQNAMGVAQLMSGTRVGPDGKLQDTRVAFGARLDQTGRNWIPEKVSMIELGFTPTFYQFVDTVIELKVAVSVARTDRVSATTQSAGGLTDHTEPAPATVTTTPVDATYAASYNYNVEYSSTIKTKLVPIPPPALLEERIQNSIQQQQQRSVLDLADSAERRAQQARTRQENTLTVVVGTNPAKVGVKITEIELGAGRKNVLTPNDDALMVPIVSEDASATAQALATALNTDLPNLLDAQSSGATVVLRFKSAGRYEIEGKPAKASLVNNVQVSKPTYRPAK